MLKTPTNTQIIKIKISLIETVLISNTLILTASQPQRRLRFTLYVFEYSVNFPERLQFGPSACKLLSLVLPSFIDGSSLHMYICKMHISNYFVIRQFNKINYRACITVQKHITVQKKRQKCLFHPLLHIYLYFSYFVCKM